MCVCACVCVAGHSNDPRCDSLSGPTHSSWEKGGWAVGRTVHGSANRKKKERKKERGRVRGFLIQSALSASGSKSHTTSIFHTRRSQGAGAAGVCVICWVLCLHRVCMCMCVCFFLCVCECVCVCVWGGLLFMGKLHSSVIWLIYGPQLPHLTVRIAADEITGICHSN